MEVLRRREKGVKTCMNVWVQGRSMRATRARMAGRTGLSTGCAVWATVALETPRVEQRRRARPAMVLNDAVFDHSSAAREPDSFVLLRITEMLRARLLVACIQRAEVATSMAQVPYEHTRVTNIAIAVATD